MKTRTSAGNSLVEALLATTILAGLGTLVFSIIGGSGRAFQTQSGYLNALERSRDLANRLASELQGASVGSLQGITSGVPGTMTEGIEFNGVVFQNTTAYEGELQLGNPIRIELAEDPADPVDGQDNSGEGLVDERLVTRRVNGGAARTLGRCMAGLTFRLTGRTLTIAVDQRLRAAGETVPHRHEVSVHLRNP
jgi:hypothetical protein